MAEIFSIAIITGQGVGYYQVGQEVTGSRLDKIILDSKYINGDPYDYYFGLNKESKIIFEISALCPLEIHYGYPKEATHE